MKKLFLSLLLFAAIFSYAQSNQIDSLKLALKNAKHDTTRCNILNEMINAEADDNIWPQYNEQLKELAEKNVESKTEPKSFYLKFLATALNNIGFISEKQGDIPKALEYHHKSLKIREEIKFKEGIALSLNNIGAIYDSQGDIPKALEYYHKSLKIHEEIKGKYGIAYSLNNIGSIYKSQGDIPKALEYLHKSLKIREEIKDKLGMANSLNNIGFIYISQGDIPKALEYLHKSLKIREENNDKSGMVISLNNIAHAMLKSGRAGEAFPFATKGMQLAKELGFPEKIKTSASRLKTIFQKQNKYKEAFEMYELEIKMKDSINNEETQKAIVKKQMQYEYEIQTRELKNEQDKKDLLAKAELEQREKERNYFIIGFALVVVLAGFIFRSYRQKQKANIIITKEKQRSEELLLNILPAEVAEELKLKGSAEANLIDEVTVLFTDFKGFTQYSETLSPKQLVAEIHECFSAFDSIMEKHNIEKIKTIGDSYMAAGGLPTANKTHAIDVVSAAFEIQAFMQKYKQKKSKEGKDFFEIRIGIHTGPVVAGIVGVKKFAYDIWGDTVNTASRMESSGEEGKVNISETTYQIIKDKFVCSHRGKVKAKNKGEIDMYFVEGAI